MTKLNYAGCLTQTQSLEKTAHDNSQQHPKEWLEPICQQCNDNDKWKNRQYHVSYKTDKGITSYK